MNDYVKMSAERGSKLEFKKNTERGWKKKLLNVHVDKKLWFFLLRRPDGCLYVDNKEVVAHSK